MLKKHLLKMILFSFAFVTFHVEIEAQVSAWRGDESRFIIAEDRLRLNAPAVGGTAYLSKPSVAIEDASWEFVVKMDFNPSGSNYARVYITSDRADLRAALNGYFISIGEANDEVSLYRQTGTSRIKIIDGVDDLVNNLTVLIGIRLTRTEGHWELSTAINNVGPYVLAGSVIDETHTASSFTGLVCTYTATRSTGFSFQYVSSTGTAYVPPPQPAWKELIVTEIFADPTPRVAMPEAEYIELYNRGTNTINLSGWHLADGGTEAVLPSYRIKPQQYVLITAASSLSEFADIKNVLGIRNFPSLNNTGEPVMLRFSDGTLIDSVRYTDAWYKDDSKKEGGWSLELIDPENICAEESNWTASENDTGGTPGAKNSVYANKPDLTPPQITSAIPSGTQSLRIQVNEKLSQNILRLSDISLTPFVPIDRVAFCDPSLRCMQINLQQALLPKTKYSIVIKNLTDCAGNTANESPVMFVLPEPGDSLDVMISEVLFNPRPTGVDFIELVNVSDKYINLKNWSFANVSEDKVTQVRKIRDSDLILEPGAYLAFTTRKNILLGEYSQAVAEHVIEVASLPAMNDDEGSVVLLDAENSIVDALRYVKESHSVFLKNEEGVSLERISMNLPTNDPANWTSASAACGFATPGYINSNMLREQPFPDESVQVVPEIFIPASGQPAFAQILYRLDRGGYIANAKVLDANGRLIRQLANNELLGSEGAFRWDGDRDDGTKARVGYYVVYLELFNSDGVVHTFRKRVAIAARF